MASFLIAKQLMRLLIALAVLISCSPPSQQGNGPDEAGDDDDFARSGVDAPVADGENLTRQGSNWSRPTERARNEAEQIATSAESGVNKHSVVDRPSEPQGNPPAAPNPPPSTLPTPQGPNPPMPNNPPNTPPPSPDNPPNTPPPPIGSPGPNESPPPAPPPTGEIPGGSNSCKVASNTLNGGFSLSGEGDDSYLPFTLLIEVQKQEKGKSPTTSRCVGIVEDLVTDVWVGKVSRSVAFPRVILAQHCLKTTDDTKITKVTFSDPKSSTKTVTMLEGEGVLVDEVSKKAIWHIDLNTLKAASSDPCTEQTKKTEGKTPCFTMYRDRLTLITPIENGMLRTAREEAKKVSDTASLVLRLPESYEKQDSVIAGLPKPDATRKTIDWAQLYVVAGLRGAKTWDINKIPSKLLGLKDLDKQDLATVKEAFRNFINQNLKSLRFSKVIRNNKTGPEIKLYNPGTWEDLVELYIENPGSGYSLVAVGLTEKATKMIQRQQPDFRFRQGDSGTVLLAEIQLIKPPLITLTREFTLVGVLSTVAGIPVCEGDDLSCCETK